MDSAGDQPHGLGLPHSEIRESTSARLSSRLFAACHVLHRLSVPRHPPDALKTLDPSPAIFAARRDKPCRVRRQTTLKTLLPVNPNRKAHPVTRTNKTYGPHGNPWFTHINNVKQPAIRGQ